MTTNELMEFCKNLAMLRRWRDEGGSSLDDATLIALTERLRAGRQRVQDVYRTVRDRLEAVLDYGKVALGEEDFLAAKREIDDAPPEPPRKRGRPAKPKTDDLPGQGDLYAYADQAADQAKAVEDERRVNPDLALDLEIMQALRKGGRLSTEEIAEHVVRPRLDVAQRIAELETQGQIRVCQHARGRWEIPPADHSDYFAPKNGSNPQGGAAGLTQGSESKIDPKESKPGASAEEDEEIEGGRWAPFRVVARQVLTEPTTTKALAGAFRRELKCTLDVASQAIDELVSEGTLVLDGRGKVAVKRDDTDPFVPSPALEEAPL